MARSEGQTRKEKLTREIAVDVGLEWNNCGGGG